MGEHGKEGIAVIRTAKAEDIDQVEKGYTDILRFEQEHVAYTVWKAGVYPTRATAVKAFQEGALYVMEQEGKICASMILNQVQPQEYDNIQWKYEACPGEALVVHLLCVNPSEKGRGIGKEMVRFAIEEGKRRGCRTVRLDTGAQNTPAAALYKKLGFELAGTSSMAIGGLIAHDRHLFFEHSCLHSSP